MNIVIDRKKIEKNLLHFSWNYARSLSGYETLKMATINTDLNNPNNLFKRLWVSSVGVFSSQLIMLLFKNSITYAYFTELYRFYNSNKREEKFMENFNWVVLKSIQNLIFDRKIK